MDNTARGLYRKYFVERTDGSSEAGKKHHDCEYFVLDMHHDKHAISALRAYILSCRKEYPALAENLSDKVAEMECRFQSAAADGRDKESK